MSSGTAPFRRITPTGWARAGGRRRRSAPLLGSTRAVVDALPDGAVMIVRGADEAANVRTQLEAAGRPVDALRVYHAGGCGSELLYSLPPATVIGVDVEAFAGVVLDHWEDVRRIIPKRFVKCVWG